MNRLIRLTSHYRLFSIALGSGVAGLVLQLLKLHTAAHWVLGIASIAETFPLVWDMWQDIRSGRYGIDVLAATAIVTSVLLQQYWAAIVVVLMLTGGQALEAFANRRAQSELDALLKHAPRIARVIRKGKTLEVKVEEIKVGDKVLVRPGEVVPVDGLMIDGSSNMDESSLTGESLPQPKGSDDTVISGTVSTDGAITIKASATADDSQYQQIIRLVRGAAASESPFVRLADRYSLPFTFAAYAIAIAVWVLSGQAIRFLEVIIVATPCPLLLAAPIALISGMARASRYGVIVKHGSALEKLAEAKTIVFDKTGTLTRGVIKVDKVIIFNGGDEKEVLQLAASLETNSNHVLASAIVEGAKKHGVKLIKAKHIDETPGLGITASVKGGSVMVGNVNMMQGAGVKLPAKHDSKKLSTAAYVARNGELLGVITFTDEIREETAETLRYIHKLGIKHVAMITGDNATAAEAVASALSIDDVYPDAMPADKLRILSKIKARPVVFVGDGVNDAPVLTSANVGIALGAKGSTAASESADMVVLLDDVSRVAVALEIARKTFSIATQSILVGIGLSLLLMLVFATGKFPPLAGAIIQEAVDIVVIFNALRAHMIKLSMVDQQ